MVYFPATFLSFCIGSGWEFIRSIGVELKEEMCCAYLKGYSYVRIRTTFERTRVSEFYSVFSLSKYGGIIDEFVLMHSNSINWRECNGFTW